MIEKNPTELLKINIEDNDEHGIPFTNKDLKILWENRDNDIAQVLLIMYHPGYRIGKLSVIGVNLDSKSFSDGLKTRTSKERVVPIHSTILPIISQRLKEYGSVMCMSNQNFRNLMYSYIKSIGIERHTPHDCQHTFSRLCEEYSVRENERKRMLGHKIGDITKDTYGHRALTDLREELEKIPSPNLL